VHGKENIRQIIGKKTAAALALAVFVVCVMAFPQETEAMKTIGNPDAEAPELTAEAACIYSLDLDRLVYGYNEDEQLPPYSMTKMLTCYLAAENLDLDQEVEISAEAAKEYPDGSEMDLSEGEIVTVRDLIYGSMLWSGNDAACALGEAVSGTESEFADLMNETAAEWGCENTHFVNANGWDDDDQYTTAADLAVIAKHCFANEIVAEAASTKEYTVDATNMFEEREMENFSLKANDYNKDILYAKTGSWSSYDCGITFEFKKGSLTAIAVLMSDTEDGREEDSEALMEFASEVTPGFIPAEKGDEVGLVWVKGGSKTRMKVCVDATTVAYPESEDEEGVEVKLVPDEELTAPVSKGDKVGKYEVYANGDLVAEANLCAAEDITEGWFPSNIYISNLATVIILLALALTAITAVIIKRNSLKDK